MDRVKFRMPVPVPTVVLFTLVLLPMDARAQITVEPAEIIGDLGLSWRSGPFEPGAEGGLVSRDLPEVTGVIPCSPAHLAGVEPGDRIIEVNNRPGRHGRLFPEATPGFVYNISLQRGDQTISVRLAVGHPRADTTRAISAAPMPSPAAAGCPGRPLDVPAQASDSTLRHS